LSALGGILREDPRYCLSVPRFSLGYQIFMGWVATNPDAPQAHPEGGAS
jgi:hypothetical protein